MTDLISRQAAIKAIDDLPNCYNGYSDTYDKECIIGVLEELPSVDEYDVVAEYCRKRELVIITADLFGIMVATGYDKQKGAKND